MKFCGSSDQHLLKPGSGRALASVPIGFAGHGLGQESQSVAPRVMDQSRWSVAAASARRRLLIETALRYRMVSVRADYDFHPDERAPSVCSLLPPRVCFSSMTT